MIFDLVASNVFVIYDQADGSNVAFLKFVNEELNLNQSLGIHGTLNLSVSNQLVMVSEARSLIKNVSANNFLDLQHKASPTKELWANDTLVLIQKADHSIFLTASNFLNLNQTAINSRGIENNLILNQEAICNVIRNIRVNQILTFISLIELFIPNGKYIEINIPAFTNTKVTLTYGSFVLELKRPEFDNTDSIELARISRLTRAGDLVISRDSKWPTTEKLKMKFINLSATKTKSLLDFLEISLGQDIKLLDYEGSIWEGVILNPETEIVQEYAPDCGGYNTELEFQGRIVNRVFANEAKNTITFEGASNVL